MNIILVSPECYPFIKESSTADLVSLISKGIEKYGHNTTVFIPRYSLIDAHILHIERVPLDFKIKFESKGKEKVINTSIYKGIIPNSLTGVFLIESQNYFTNSKEIYSLYEQDEERFSFFSKAVLDICNTLDIKPNIIHLFDPPTIDVARLLHINKIEYAPLKKAKVVLTISNLGSYPTSCLLNNVSFIDIITTSSKAFAKELFSSTKKRSLLYSIESGIDEEVYNPELDNSIAYKYSKNYFSVGKRKCKEDLLESLNFSQDLHLPLFSIFQRIDENEETNLLLNALQSLCNMNLKLVIFVSGNDSKIQEINKLAPKNKNIKLCRCYDEKTALKLISGSDFLISLKNVEPDGMHLQTAMKYGCIPIAYETGAVKEIIYDDETCGITNGIKFKKYTKEDLLDAISKAISLYKDKIKWSKLVKSAMDLKTQTKTTVAEYINCYEKITTSSRNFNPNTNQTNELSLPENVFQ